MWIRSQNKMQLVDGLRIMILSPNIYRKEYEIINYITARPTQEDSCEDYDTLGKYTTKERAVEVLDEINELIEDIEQLKLNVWDSQSFFQKHKAMVYQMPQE